MPSDTTDEVRLTPKEYAKKQRRKAYELAKERRKSDPRYIAMKEKMRQQRRAAYQKTKERTKVARVARKKAAAEIAKTERAAKDRALMVQLKTGSSLEQVHAMTSL